MRTFKIPHVFIFLFWIIILCSVLSYVIPSGKYDRKPKDSQKTKQTVVKPESYTEIPKHYSLKSVLIGEEVEGKASPTSLLGVFAAIPKGLSDSAALVFYVFLIGAVFTLIHYTGALNAALFSLIERFNTRPKQLFFILYILVFSGSAFLGLLMEVIPLIPIFLFLAKRMGYDRMFGFGMVGVPIFLGWSTGVTNPFTVLIAQSVAELPPGSGIGLRLVLYVVCAGLGFYFLMRYGERVRMNPSLSHLQDDPFNLEEYGNFEKVVLTRCHVRILGFFVASYAAILVAVQLLGWRLIEMSACFVCIAIVVTFLAGMSGDEAMAALTKGLEIMIVPALVVGVARGIYVVLQEAQVIDSILHYASSSLMSMPLIIAGEGMLLFQSVLNFFIPSASGQALVSMPLMTPLSDILGLSRQTAVLAFILGDGLSNIIIPTNGVLMAMLGVAKVPFEKWFKFVLPLFLASMVVAMGFVAVAILTGY
ncbi:MAG: hypothetical protein AAGI38_12890 [Bacteroidota bacterium]